MARSITENMGSHLDAGAAAPLGVPVDITDKAKRPPAPVEFMGDKEDSRLWKPKQVIITPAAWDEELGQEIVRRSEALGIEVLRAKNNRITGLRGPDERATYRTAKRTLAVVNAPPSAAKLQPIPPSADWQFHLAEGCPGHCQYCYLAGSLSGPPVVRVFANLPWILKGLESFIGQTSQKAGESRAGTTETSFECSCYTDPLALEHLTGSLSMAIEHFGRLDGAHLRWTTKYDNVDPLLDLEHNGKTRIRFSVNALPITEHFEGGTAKLGQRLAAAGKVARAGYKLGFTIAPIMPLPDWQEHYEELLDQMSAAIGDTDVDLTFELITHRFTPGSKEVLMGWYPQTKLEMDEESRTVKMNKFGGRKYVYNKPTMTELKSWFEQRLAEKFPNGRVLYWT